MLVRGFIVGFFCGLAEFASVYTSCVPRGALRFLMKFSYLSKKNW
jgi:hypothetical protein